MASMVAGVVFLVMHLSGYQFPNLITPFGRDVAQGVTLFGWIILGLVMILVHIGMRERKEAELARQKDRIEDLFCALFHDLGTLLGSAALGASALRSTSQAEALDGADIIDRSVSAMSEILTGARLLYALDRGLVDAGPPTAGLAAVVTTTVGLVAARVAAKAIRLEVDDAALVGIEVAGDEKMLIHHVLVNVVANAVKFSRIGGAIRLTATVAGQGIVAVAVSDEGVGMSSDLARTLFSGDGPVVRPGTAGERGSGFGLQLARAFLVRYGGDLRIESRDGSAGGAHGTTVRVLLTKAG